MSLAKKVGTFVFFTVVVVACGKSWTQEQISSAKTSCVAEIASIARNVPNEAAKTTICNCVVDGLSSRFGYDELRNISDAGTAREVLNITNACVTQNGATPVITVPGTSNEIDMTPF